MSLLYFEHQFSNLKLNTRGGGEKSPHKVAMLLAVIDLIEDGIITENHIDFDGTLRSAFTRHFTQLSGPNDRDNPHLPFFHLRSSGFWHHFLKPGQTDVYANLSTATGPKSIHNTIAFACLDDELFELLDNEVARALLKTSLHKNLSEQDRTELLEVGSDWDWLEYEAIVQDYFTMLNQELLGQKYSKAKHRRGLISRLIKRNAGSIELKHQNISATLVEMGFPYIQGYKPLFNYQQQLKQVVLAHMAAHQTDIEHIAQTADSINPATPTQINWARVLDPKLPERLARIQEPKCLYLRHKPNYTEREHNNRRLGKLGEAFVIQYERYRLSESGRPDLAKEVEWSSSELGDGLGYDIRSFDPNRNEELFIEVKTTNSGKCQPFFISKNEVDFSQERADQFSLYRVYDFRKHARLFQLNGAVDQHVHLQPQSYKASF